MCRFSCPLSDLRLKCVQPAWHPSEQAGWRLWVPSFHPQSSLLTQSSSAQMGQFFSYLQVDCCMCSTILGPRTPPPSFSKLLFPSCACQVKKGEVQTWDCLNSCQENRNLSTSALSSITAAENAAMWKESPSNAGVLFLAFLVRYDFLTIKLFNS